MLKAAHCCRGALSACGCACRMKKETLSENRMRFLLQQILKRLHEWKRDEDKEELDRVRALAGLKEGQ